MSTRTFYLEGGKYEIDRNSAGLVTAARRHGEPWPAGFESMQFNKCAHAMLNRIEELEDKLAELADEPNVGGNRLAPTQE